MSSWRNHIPFRPDRAITRLPAPALWLPIVLLIMALAAVSCNGGEGEGEELRIAAASNIYPTVEAAAEEFTQRTGIKVLVTPGASGFLANQIEQGAPYDIFISADRRRVEELATAGHIDVSSVAIYARGVLVLAWPAGHDPVSLDDLRNIPENAKLALPNPAHAPYGQAAVALLRNRGLLETVQNHFVLAENVGQAQQYLETGNVTAGFLPLSLARAGNIPHTMLDSDAYPPIEQALGVVTRSTRKQAASQFLDGFLGDSGTRLLTAAGYAIPVKGAPNQNAVSPRGRRGMDWRPVLLTLEVATTATVLSVVFGTLLGHFFGMRRFTGRRWFLAATMLPLALPPTVLGFYLLVLLGRQSALGSLWENVFGEPLVFTTKAAVIAACVAAVPIIIRQMSVAFGAINPEVLEAGRIDGAGGVRIFWELQLPLVRPALVSGATIAFARSVGDFGATLMVAGNIPGETQTASIAIYELMNANRKDEAFVLVLIITAIAVVVLASLAGRDKVEH